MAALFLVYLAGLMCAFWRKRNTAFAIMIVNIVLTLLVLLYHTQI